MVLCLGAVGIAGCGSSGGAQPDGGTTANYRLVILDPPGDSLGLAFGEQVTLRVRYETDAGDAIQNADVNFMLELGNETGPGGSALTGDISTTDSLGVARIDLHAGAQRAQFRVSASAENAPSAFFYVSVSEDGFAELTVTPVHVGNRDETAFERVELRLFRVAKVTCETFDVDAPPMSLFPPRSLGGFGGSVNYRNVSAGEAYTLVAWALYPDNETRLAVGCVDIGTTNITPGSIGLEVVVTDRAAALPSKILLTSAFDLSPLLEKINEAGANSAWAALACPLGPGQLLLDCTLDVLVSDGTLDCIVDGSNATIISVEAKRGDPDTSGCRPANVAAADSLDKMLNDAIVAGGSFPTGASLQTLVSAIPDVLDLFELRSELELLAPGSARHSLSKAIVNVGGTDYELDLTATARSVLVQAPVAYLLGSDDTLAIANHGFTLRYGSFAAAAFRDVALASFGLDDRASELGQALAESTADTNTATTGCEAASAIICSEIGQMQTCSETACYAAATALDDMLVAWWQLLDGATLDFHISGTAPLYDMDDDLFVDAVGFDGPQSETGLWQTSFSTELGDAVDTVGGFTSTSVVE